MLNIDFFFCITIGGSCRQFVCFCAQYEANGDRNVSLKCDIESDSESGSSRELKCLMCDQLLSTTTSLK